MTRLNPGPPKKCQPVGKKQNILRTILGLQKLAFLPRTRCVTSHMYQNILFPTLVESYHHAILMSIMQPQSHQTGSELHDRRLARPSNAPLQAAGKLELSLLELLLASIDDGRQKDSWHKVEVLLTHLAHGIPEVRVQPLQVA